MSMLDWAEKEIELACKRENPDRKEGEWDYVCACYESAFKAFKSLMEDGHSGLSIGVTKNILNRLIDGKPLTPIEDTDDIWEDTSGWTDNGIETYQCKRMSSLFKWVYPDGTVKYSDSDRDVCVDINSGTTYRFGFVSNIIDDMFPITMPYMPDNEPYEIYTEQILSDPESGLFNTIGILYAITPHGERVEINRFFAEKDDKLEEITKEIMIAIKGEEKCG